MQAIEKLRAFFDAAAPGWATRDFERVLMEELLDRVGLKRGDRVVDLGGGTGHLLYALRRRVGEAGSLCLVDLSLAMLQHAAPSAAETHTCRCRGVAERLPLREASRDAVVGMGLYPHLTDRAAALAEISRVLVPGGRLAFLHLIGRQRLNELHGGIGGVVGDHLLPSGDQVAETLEAAGFAVLDVLDREDAFLVSGRSTH